MKWGRKKPSSAAAAAASSSSSHPSLISHVLPTSWLAKFKQITVNSGQKHRNMRQKGKEKPEPWSSPRCGHVGGGGKFSGGDGDAFWRLSFGDADDGVDVGKIAGLSRLSCFDSDEEPEFQPSNCQSCKPKAAKLCGKEDAHKFSNMVSHAREMRGLPREVEFFPPTEPCIREKVAEIRTPRLRVEKEKKVRKRNQRILEEKEPEFHGEPYELEGTQRKAIAEKYYETESGGTDGITEREDCKLTAFDSSDSCVRKAAETSAFPSLKESEEFSTENKSPEWQKLKEMKIEEVLSRSEKQRKSLYISRELSRRRPKHNNRIRVYSPRTASKVEICKIRALEDMKKAKLRMKKKAKEKAVEGFMGLESFAVVKCSFDPHKDFRESMVEMIQEKRISQPEELEELLACYLTLNSDQYHDLIIKVFRQVWFDLNPVCFDTELEDEHLYRDQPRFRQ